jgi:hypothetical protein
MNPTWLTLGAAGALAAASLASGRRRGARNWRHWDHPIGPMQVSWTFGWGRDEATQQFHVASQREWLDSEAAERAGRMEPGRRAGECLPALALWDSFRVAQEIYSDEPREWVGIAHPGELTLYGVFWEPVAVAATSLIPADFDASRSATNRHLREVRDWALENLPPGGYDDRLMSHALVHVRSLDPRRPLRWNGPIRIGFDLGDMTSIYNEDVQGLGDIHSATVSTVVLRLVELFDPFRPTPEQLEALARMGSRIRHADYFVPTRGLGGRRKWYALGRPVSPQISRLLEGGPQGSRSVTTAQGFHRTAIARTGPSAPHRAWKQAGLLGGRVLDYGSGRGADCKATATRCYDPNHPDPKVRQAPPDDYDAVTLTYVLNVLPPTERKEALQAAARRVRRGGHLLVAVRGQSDGGHQAAQAGWERHADGFVQRTTDGAVQRFQRFYTDAGLAREVEKALTGRWRRVEGPAAPSGSVMQVWARG